MKIVVKGIMTAEDASAAANCPGVDGIICSNHGGRQLDATLGAAVRPQPYFAKLLLVRTLHFLHRPPVVLFSV